MGKLSWEVEGVEMKLSIFTTVKHSVKRQDLYFEPINCFLELADQLVMVDGNTYIQQDKDRIRKICEGTPITHVPHGWRKEFKWPFIGEQFQRGYEACTGDWVIHADLDFLFHENDLQAIRQACEHNNEAPALSFYKRQFYLPDRFNIKSRLVVAVNKGKYGDRIRFDSGGDLCQPSLDGIYIDPQDVPEAQVPIWNYECLLKTKEQLLEDKGRFARAWQRHFGSYKLGGPDDQSAYNEWLKMATGRFYKPSERIPFDAHPKYIKETIKALTPDQWGYNGFGLIEGRAYG